MDVAQVVLLLLCALSGSDGEPAEDTSFPRRHDHIDYKDPCKAGKKMFGSKSYIRSAWSRDYNNNFFKNTEN